MPWIDTFHICAHACRTCASVYLIAWWGGTWPRGASFVKGFAQRRGLGAISNQPAALQETRNNHLSQHQHVIALSSLVTWLLWLLFQLIIDVATACRCDDSYRCCHCWLFVLLLLPSLVAGVPAEKDQSICLLQILQLCRLRPGWWSQAEPASRSHRLEFLGSRTLHEWETETNQLLVVISSDCTWWTLHRWLQPNRATPAPTKKGQGTHYYLEIVEITGYVARIIAGFGFIYCTPEEVPLILSQHSPTFTSIHQHSPTFTNTQRRMMTQLIVLLNGTSC